MGVWIETAGSSAAQMIAQRHTLYGCVDWNTHAFYWVVIALSHTLYGCVDWNQAMRSVRLRWNVTPCMGVWIETFSTTFKIVRVRSHTLYGCVDWNLA